MMTLVSRDPFARLEVHRSPVPAGDGCSWCGGFRYRAGTRLSTLYSYRIESDGGSSAEQPGKFCGISCFNSFQGR